MEDFDSFDQIGQYSNMELKKKLYKLKQNKFHDFLLESMDKSYILYKKNKNCKISFNDYQAQLLKEFEKQNNLKNYEKKKL